MDTNYFEELTQQYPAFAGAAHKFTTEDRQDPPLCDLIHATHSALTIHKKKLIESNTTFSQYNAQLRKQKVSEFLQKANAELEIGIENFMRPIIGIAETAAQAYESARTPKAPENSVDYLREQEIRNRLASMSVPERTQTLQDQIDSGNFQIFEAISHDPLPSKDFLGSLETDRILNETAELYASTRYPEVWTRQAQAKSLLEKAQMIKDLALSAGRRQNEAQAGL
jgi:hypothetical protein